MKEIEVGTKVLVRAEVDAFRTGLNSGVLIRVDVNGQKIWVKSEDIQLMRDVVESIYNDTPKCSIRKVASFNDHEAAEAFMDYLADMIGARREEA